MISKQTIVKKCLNRVNQEQYELHLGKMDENFIGWEISIRKNINSCKYSLLIIYIDKNNDVYLCNRINTNYIEWGIIKCVEFILKFVTLFPNKDIYNYQTIKCSKKDIINQYILIKNKYNRTFVIKRNFIKD